jgi:hypothetical protein
MPSVQQQSVYHNRLIWRDYRLVPALTKFALARPATDHHLHACTPIPVAIGLSKGAIVAAATLLTRPGLLAGAILFPPLSPFTHDPPARLDRHC